MIIDHDSNGLMTISEINWEDAQMIAVASRLELRRTLFALDELQMGDEERKYYLHRSIKLKALIQMAESTRKAPGA